MEKDLVLDVKKITDEKIEDIIANIKPEDDIPDAVMAVMQNDFKEYLKKDEEMTKTIEEIQQEYAQLLEDNEKEFEEMTKDMSLDRLIEKMENLRDIAFQTGNEKVCDHYNNLIRELQSSITLELMFKAIEKMKNPKKISQQVDSRFEAEFKKFRRNLETNTKYMFNDPAGLLDVLKGLTEEKNAKVFLYSLFRFTNAKGQGGINSHSIFIGQLIKNIYSLNDPEFNNSHELLTRINQYAEKLI